MFNEATLIGRLGADPEVRYTQNGTPVATFQLATNERWKDREGQSQERTEWHNIVLWGKLAEIANDYLRKGSPVYIEGRLQTRSWDDRDGNKRYTTEIVGTQMQMLGRAEGGGGGGRIAEQDEGGDRRGGSQTGGEKSGADVEDDLPF